jgi:hypothetical protein
MIRGAAPCQPRMAVARVPPCPRALAPPRTQECVRRCPPTPAQGRAPAPHLPLVGPIPLVLEISPAMVQRFERFFRGGLPPPHPTQAPSALPQGEPSHGGVAPCHSPRRCRLLDLGALMERRLPVRGVEPVARPGKQRLDVLPPPSPTTHSRPCSCGIPPASVTGWRAAPRCAAVCPWGQRRRWTRRSSSLRENRTPLAARPWPCHEARRARAGRGPAWRSRALAGRVGPSAPSRPSPTTGRRQRPGATSKTVRPAAA